MPSTLATIGLVLWASECRNLIASEARGVTGLEVPSFRKSSRSLPAVNMPGSPEMIRQRIDALSCAVSIAALMSRYMSCVIAFFFSGRRKAMMRTASSSVTVTCPVIGLALKQSAMAGAIEISYIIHGLTQNRGSAVMREGIVQGRTMQLTGIHHLTAISAKPREN